MMTEFPFTGRLTNWLAAGVGLATIVVMVGVSLLAGVFLLAPLVFVAILLKTAFRHYFGSTEPAHPRQ